MIQNDNRRAALYMIVGMAGFTINDALMKEVLATLPLSESIAIRGLIASGFVVGFAFFSGALKHWWCNISALFVVRMALETCTTYAFLNALKTLPLADATAILMAAPLGVTMAASLFFGEQVGWRRYLAIIIGFAGVLIILQPEGGVFQPGHILAVLTVVLMVSRDLVTRRMPKDLPSLFVACGSALSITLVALIFMITESWQPVSQAQMINMTAAGFFIFMGYVFTILTVRTGEISAVAPFRYTALLFAILLGWLFFDELPGSMVLLGSFIVVGSGLYMLRRESQPHNKQTP